MKIIMMILKHLFFFNEEIPSLAEALLSNMSKIDFTKLLLIIYKLDFFNYIYLLYLVKSVFHIKIFFSNNI